MFYSKVDRNMSSVKIMKMDDVYNIFNNDESPHKNFVKSCQKNSIPLKNMMGVVGLG